MKATMKNVNYAKRSYHYVKNYGMAQLRRKVGERLYRNRLERGYQNWMTDSRPAPSEKELQREHRFSSAPLLSVVVPVYRTLEPFFREMVESAVSYKQLRAPPTPEQGGCGGGGV